MRGYGACATNSEWGRVLLVRRVGALCCKAGIPPPLNTKVQSVAASQADLTSLCQQPQTTASRQSCVLPGTHCAGHHTVHKVTEGLLGRSHMAIRQTLNQRMQGRQLLAGCCCHCASVSVRPGASRFGMHGHRRVCHTCLGACATSDTWSGWRCTLFPGCILFPGTPSERSF